ncbi:hypothetical protein LIPSTDRAFT_107346 [Lipomyces starkeyi NRRL Y-11557]|uniref:Uncharacterized protein n=1 Tax=Lipomyces starkeyi NRRL Y-11557 TaxID=675824 RepID=A0A1E3PXZ1_LIPST|nr:hypothetical protein LIPSTDRAFT_107346 [Lipomyces starkeyi NRRL Y-11557]
MAYTVSVYGMHLCLLKHYICDNSPPLFHLWADRGRQEELDQDQAAVQQPSTPNWSVNVTIAGTDPYLLPGQAVTGTKWNIDALEDTRSGGA